MNTTQPITINAAIAYLLSITRPKNQKLNNPVSIAISCGVHIIGMITANGLPQDMMMIRVLAAAYNPNNQ